jgi:UTP--glucose-1-phosphate uridylyltransferase
MLIRKAVITVAGRTQRRLPFQNFIDRDGREKSVLAILLEEAASAGVESIGVVAIPTDIPAMESTARDFPTRVGFIAQEDSRGYGHAVWCARDFTAGEPFLHLVGDHLFLSLSPRCCTEQIVALAQAENCSVSAVQSTREGLLSHFGAVGGARVTGRDSLYRIDTVIEKPTPTEAEQRLIVPGLRAGHYLCFFGLHVLTPAVMSILDEQLAASAEPVSLSPALAELARRERYLAATLAARRYDLGGRYGLLTAQMALALAGHDREAVLATLLELLAQRETDRAAEPRP